MHVGLVFSQVALYPHVGSVSEVSIHYDMNGSGYKCTLFPPTIVPTISYITLPYIILQRYLLITRFLVRLIDKPFYLSVLLLGRRRF